MEIKGHAKVQYFSSDGTIGLLIKETNRVVFFNSDSCKLIKGVDGYLSCYLSNNIRVYTPVVIKITENYVMVNFTMEEVKFVAQKAKEMPKDFYSNGIPESIGVL